MLEPIADELWIADGSVVSFLTVPYPTRMGVVRLSNGELWVWSPVGLTDEFRSEVSALAAC